MSGGYFDYAQYNISNIIDSIEQVILLNDDDTLDDFGQTRGRMYSEKTIQRMKDGIEILKRAQIYAQRIDYLLSDDDGENEFHKRLDEELKQLDE